MCGIAGTYTRPGARAPEPARLVLAMEQLRRRGPDDSGVWSDAQVQLGHRRLAVVDLSPTGHQPMESHDGRYVIVFNGEIYNHLELRAQLDPAHIWRGRSDTETLLQAYRRWGAGCLSRLNGMFAFAIWDRTEQRLFAARDRFGKKPFYYNWDDGNLAFASRPTAVAKLLGSARADIAPQALRLYLELGYIPAPLSPYHNIHKLPPAHWLLADQRGLRIERYWNHRDVAPQASLLQRPEEELVDELEEHIQRAVRLRLMSDVSLGAFLSGGIDSAMVVAAMKFSGVSEPKTYTIGFNEAAYDEGPAARTIARHLGVEHVVETLDVEDLLDLLPAFIEEFDEPFADASAFPTMAVARMARQHVTVALTGDGGDELFGGYHYYPIVEQLGRFMHWPRAAKNTIGNLLGIMPGHKAKLVAGALGMSTPASLFQYLRSLSKDFTSLVSADVLGSTYSAADLFEQAAASYHSGLSRAELGMRLDMEFTLADGYLQKIDVATMAYSLEARCPLLDHTLAEWALRLPLRYKIREGQTKYLLKKVLCRHLPRELVYRPKKGFGVPSAQWLRGPLKNWALELINDQSVMSRLPLEKARVLELFRLHNSGSRDAQPLLWSVLMLLCFVSCHINGQGIPDVTRRRAAA